MQLSELRDQIARHAGGIAADQHRDRGGVLGEVRRRLAGGVEGRFVENDGESHRLDQVSRYLLPDPEVATPIRSSPHSARRALAGSA